MSLLRVKQTGVFRPLGMSWGPTGRSAPYTPAYSTPATATANSIAALQSALNSASSGDVIEFTPAVGEESATWTLTGGSGIVGSTLNWAANVLIRPPLGTRKTLGGVTIEARGVTLAGYDITGIFVISNTNQTTKGQRSGGWRILGPLFSSTFKASGITDGFMIEPVFPRRYYGSQTQSDRFRVLAVGTTDCVNFLLDGGYVMGVIPGVANYGGTGPGGTRTVVASSQVSPTAGMTFTTTLAGYTAPMAIDMALVMLPKPKLGDSVTVSFKKNGTAVITLTVPAATTSLNNITYNMIATNDFALQRGSGTILTADNGDVITVTVDATTGTPGSVIWQLGNEDIANHSDTFQVYCGSDGFNRTGRVKGLIVRNSFLDGSDNAAMQTEDLAEDFLIYRNLLGFDRGFVFRQNSNLECRTHFFGNHIQGRNVSFGYPNLSSMIKNMTVSAPSMIGGSFTPDASNNLGDLSLTSAARRPSLPDLSVMWPECPVAGDPT